MRRARERTILAGCLVAAALACASPPKRESGLLEAKWTSKDGTVLTIPFSYETDVPDHSRGEMFTTLGPSGPTLRGPYVRVEPSAQGGMVAEVYDGFGAPEWELWDHDPGGGWTEAGVAYGDFATFYTGKVVASLRAVDGGLAMRCQLDLNEPERGLLEGGRGTCQVSDGGDVELSF